ncbi:phage tail family protein [Lactiplantibacillus plantarum]|uniref:phage tail protein n=1 Tax=Lactiplantibacillus plantarum TaxID=1590 RepID=UPI000A478B2E|nr:phage tail protein [Lactiplantibacillus plantarum]MCW6132412.1 phage tail protein [Lactiplantibacillus plantarum]WKF83413.1 phage tail protein [Lactiplantibacillus plantarum]WKF87381.1 phage tail protein [Lactiplantibacillus plantarum]CAB1719583.1 hypothetical protein LAP9491_00441 [Lactiplantibacillus plantarum]
MDHDIYFGYQRPRPTEYVQFANFDSRQLNLYLAGRIANNPPTKEVTESIGYMDGIIDFSDILGRRIFDNRTIEYQFKALNINYHDRKLLEQKCKRLLLIPMRQPIYDSHDLPFYWFGKASSVTANDDHVNNVLEITVQFNVSPYALRKGQFDDIWDNFSLETGYAQFTKCSVKGTKKISLYNDSDLKSRLKVICQNDMTINGKYKYTKNYQDNPNFRLEPGINDLTVNGNGDIEFQWESEVML